jgi:hypothetical protein
MLGSLDAATAASFQHLAKIDDEGVVLRRSLALRSKSELQSKRALHKDDVHPAPELKANVLEHADSLEAERSVQAN